MTIITKADRFYTVLCASGKLCRGDAPDGLLLVAVERELAELRRQNLDSLGPEPCPDAPHRVAEYIQTSHPEEARVSFYEIWHEGKGPCANGGGGGTRGSLDPIVAAQCAADLNGACGALKHVVVPREVPSARVLPQPGAPAPWPTFGDRP